MPSVRRFTRFTFTASTRSFTLRTTALMKAPENPQSGKRGHRVWQRARHGLISYTAFVPVNPRTKDQVAVRGLFARLNARWSRLTQAQRDLWIKQAKRRNSKPRLRQSGPLTGLQLFLKVNMALGYYYGTQADVPPPFPKDRKLAVAHLSITNAGGSPRILLTCSGDPGSHTLIHACRPQRKGCKGCTTFCFIGFCPAPVDGVADITAAYIARFKCPPAGSNVVLRINQIINGWTDEPREFSAVVPDPA